jgi:hypothetical protein
LLFLCNFQVIHSVFCLLKWKIRSCFHYWCFVDRCLSFSTFFLWPLCCLFFFDIRIMIAPLVSSNSFCNSNIQTRTPLKTWGELRCSGRIGTSCSTSDIHRVNLVTNPAISREWGKDWEVLTTSGTYPWYTDYDCPFGIFKLFLQFKYSMPLKTDQLVCRWGKYMTNNENTNTFTILTNKIRCVLIHIKLKIE